MLVKKEETLIGNVKNFAFWVKRDSFLVRIQICKSYQKGVFYCLYVVREQIIADNNINNM